MMGVGVQSQAAVTVHDEGKLEPELKDAVVILKRSDAGSDAGEVQLEGEAVV